MTQEIYRRPAAGIHPRHRAEANKSTPSGSPREKLVVLPHSLSEITGPLLAHERLDALENDLTRQRTGPPLGERIIVHGRVLDEDARPVPGAMVEIWQCNAAGRYHHPGDQHDAPLDANFYGGRPTPAGAQGPSPF